jgi:hypothetical protein
MSTTETPIKRARPARSGQKLITLRQASEEYGPPYTSLRDLVVAGKLRGIKLGDGRRIWIRRADLEQLITG